MSKLEFLLVYLDPVIFLENSRAHSKSEFIKAVNEYCIETVLALHPLSDLNMKISFKNEFFVPSFKLAEMGWSIPAILFYPNTVLRIDSLPYFVVKKLIEWRFDIADLIKRGEAIDVNTLDKYPY